MLGEPDYPYLFRPPAIAVSPHVVPGDRDVAGRFVLFPRLFQSLWAFPAWMWAEG
jgi:hypothetical protein